MTPDKIKKLRDFLMEKLAEHNENIFAEAHLEELIAVCNVALRAEVVAWIPVTKRLPNRGERVLIYAGGNVSAGAMTQHPDEFVKGPSPYYGTWQREMPVDDYVDDAVSYVSPSHWMPIPEANV